MLCSASVVLVLDATCQLYCHQPALTDPSHLSTLMHMCIGMCICRPAVLLHTVTFIRLPCFSCCLSGTCPYHAGTCLHLYACMVVCCKHGGLVTLRR